MKKTSIIAVATAASLMLSSCVAGNLKKTAMEIGDVKVNGGDVAVMTYTMASMGGDFESVKTSIAKQIENSFKYGEVAKAMNIELSDEEKESAVSMRASYAKEMGGYEAYSKFLSDNGSSIEFIEDLFTATAYQQKVNETIQKKLDEKEVTDEELKKYYDDEYFCAKHILVSKEDSASADGEESTDDTGKKGKELAEELLQRAKDGEDFDALMNEYSQDPGTDSNPDGYLFTSGEMVPEFENAVKELKPGEFTMCESEYGYHVILRLDLPDIEENRDKVESAYDKKRMEDELNKLCEEYGIKVNVNEDIINSITEDMIKKPAQKDDDNATTAQ